jgi:hypothetical protein
MEHSPKRNILSIRLINDYIKNLETNNSIWQSHLKMDFYIVLNDC